MLVATRSRYTTLFRHTTECISEIGYSVFGITLRKELRRLSPLSNTNIHSVSLSQSNRVKYF